MNTNFFKDFIARLFTKNPKFFDYIQYASAAVGAISLLISYLHGLKPPINLPSWVSWLDSAAIQISSGIAFIIAQLPNKDPNQK